MQGEDQGQARPVGGEKTKEPADLELASVVAALQAVGNHEPADNEERHDAKGAEVEVVHRPLGKSADSLLQRMLDNDRAAKPRKASRNESRRASLIRS